MAGGSRAGRGALRESASQREGSPAQLRRGQLTTHRLKPSPKTAPRNLRPLEKVRCRRADEGQQTSPKPPKRSVSSLVTAIVLSSAVGLTDISMPLAGKRARVPAVWRRATGSTARAEGVRRANVLLKGTVGSASTSSGIQDCALATHAVLFFTFDPLELPLPNESAERSFMVLLCLILEFVTAEISILLALTCARAGSSAREWGQLGPALKQARETSLGLKGLPCGRGRLPAIVSVL